MTQTVFLEIYRTAGRFDAARGTLKMWVLQFAYNKSISRRNYLAVRQFYKQERIEDVSDTETYGICCSNRPHKSLRGWITEALAI